MVKIQFFRSTSITTFSTSFSSIRNHQALPNRSVVVTEMKANRSSITMPSAKGNWRDNFLGVAWAICKIIFGSIDRTWRTEYSHIVWVSSEYVSNARTITVCIPVYCVSIVIDIVDCHLPLSGNWTYRGTLYPRVGGVRILWIYYTIP